METQWSQLVTEHDRSLDIWVVTVSLNGEGIGPTGNEASR